MGYWLRVHYSVVFSAIWFFWLSTRPWLICIYSITDLLNCDMPDQSLWSTSQNPLVVPLPNTESSSDHNCIDILYFRSSTEGRWRSILKFSWNKGSSWFKCQAKFLGPTWTAEEQRYQGDNGTQMVLNSHVVQLVLAFFFFCLCLCSLRMADVCPRSSLLRDVLRNVPQRWWARRNVFRSQASVCELVGRVETSIIFDYYSKVYMYI